MLQPVGHHCFPPASPWGTSTSDQELGVWGGTSGRFQSIPHYLVASPALNHSYLIEETVALQKIHFCNSDQTRGRTRA